MFSSAVGCLLALATLILHTPWARTLMADDTPEHAALVADAARSLRIELRVRATVTGAFPVVVGQVGVVAETSSGVRAVLGLLTTVWRATVAVHDLALGALT